MIRIKLRKGREKEEEKKLKVKWNEATFGRANDEVI